MRFFVALFVALFAAVYALAQVSLPWPGPGGIAQQCTANTDGGGTFANVLGLWHFDNNGNDSSGNGHTGTLKGTANYSTTQFKFGTRSLNSPSASSINVGVMPTISGDYTFEAWLYFTTSVPSSWTFVSDNQATYEAGEAGGVSTQRFWTPGVNNTWGGTGVAANTWFHYAFVRSGTAASNVALYINGSLQSNGGGFAAMNTTIGNGSSTQVIGNFQDTGVKPVEFVDEVRISNVARYTSNFTPNQQGAFCNS